MSHLAGGLHSLPDAEEADDPDEQQTQSQVPLHGADVLDAAGDAQHVVSAEREGELRSIPADQPDQSQTKGPPNRPPDRPRPTGIGYCSVS